MCEGSSHLDLFESGDCTGGAIDSLDIGVCGPARGSARYVAQNLGTCTVEVPPMPQGEVVPVNPVTLCCTE